MKKGGCQPFLCESDGNEFLFASGGIYERVKNAWELRVPAEKTSMSKSGFEAINIEKDEDGTFRIWDYDYQYVYSIKEVDEAEEKQQIVLRVTAWQNQNTLKNALMQYQIDNPEVTIEYIFRCSELLETQQEANTLLQKTNAEIVSSQAADLYVLDHLPWEEYQKKGLLMDLSEIVYPYAENENYFGNILTAYETEEGIYAVPWFFNAKFVLCRDELVPYVHSIHELADYLEAHPEDPGLVPYYYRDQPGILLAMLYDFYGNELYEDGDITYERVESFLTSAKVIYDRTLENSDSTIMPDYEKENFRYTTFYKTVCKQEYVLFYTKQEGSFAFRPATPMGSRFMILPFHYPGSTLVSIDGIHAQFLFGIHSQTKEPEAAKDLLNYLLSYYDTSGEEDDSIRYYYAELPGMPIYKNSIIQDYERVYGAEEPPMASGYPKYSPTPEDAEKMIELLSGFKVLGEMAKKTTNDAYAILEEGGISYLTDAKSLDMVADEIYSGLMLLYHEKQ